MKQKIYGNSRAYTLDKLKRDHPALFEKVKEGKLSPNRAAIQTGFRKPATPLAQLCRAWQRASAEERATFLEKIHAVLEN